MTPVEFHAVPRSRSVEIVAGGRVVGVVRFNTATKEWLAKTGDHSRYWPSFGSALNFIEAVLGVEDWCQLRAPEWTRH